MILLIPSFRPQIQWESRFGGTYDTIHTLHYTLSQVQMEAFVDHPELLRYGR